MLKYFKIIKILRKTKWHTYLMKYGDKYKCEFYLNDPKEYALIVKFITKEKF